MDNKDKWAWEDEDEGLELFDENKVELPLLEEKENKEVKKEIVNDTTADEDLLHQFINNKDTESNDMVLDSTNYKTTVGNNMIDNDKLSWNTFSGFRDVKEEKKEVLVPMDNLNAINTNSIHNQIIKDIPLNKKKLTDDDYKNAKEKWETELDPKVKDNPLNNKTTREAIVSSSGMSLSEYLYKKLSRSDKKNKEGFTNNKGDLQIKEKVEKIVDKEIAPWENDVFVKSVKAEKENKDKVDKIRRVLSNPSKISVEDFEKENIKPSKYEKQILKTLGITQSDLSKLVAPDSSLSDYEKARLVSVGYFGTKPLGKGIKNNYAAFATIGDLHYLYFLDKFKYATTFNLALAVGRSYTNARGTMHKLFTMGLVNKIPILNAPTMWSLTETGLATINSNRKLPGGRSSEPYALSERVYVNYIAACLYSNEINALNLDDFPYKGRHFQGELVKGEELIPESDMLSSMFSEMYKNVDNYYAKDSYKGERFQLMYEQWETEWRKWENNGRKGSPEIEPRNEYMYILLSNNPFTNKYLVPDLVVSRPRDKDGSPNNIAIEVERSIKSEDDYKKKLLLYKQDTRVYGKVVYITPLNSIANRVSKVASEIGFDRFDIMPPMDKNGPTREVAGWLMI